MGCVMKSVFIKLSFLVYFILFFQLCCKDFINMLYLNDIFYNINSFGTLINSLYNNQVLYENYRLGLIDIQNYNLTFNGLNYLLSYKMFFISIIGILLAMYKK